MKRRALCLSIVVASLLPISHVSASAPRRYARTLRGSWVEEAGVCRRPSVDPSDLTMRFRCAVTGTLTGNVVAQATGDANVAVYWEEGNWVGRIDEYMFGRTSDNTCGTLHIDMRFTIDGDGTVRGVGAVLSGTGKWSGARGRYETSGLIHEGAGFGGYVLTLSLPSKPVADATVPCVPPVPKASQLPI